MTRQEKWDTRWLKMAQQTSSFSKDPSTQAGAVIVGPGNDVVSIGYNGFARGVEDAPDRLLQREVKYLLTLHAEVNAVLFADRGRLKGACLYTWPLGCCAGCAAIVIQSGVVRCVSPPLPKHLEDRWGESTRCAKVQFEEAGVELVFLEE